MGRNLLEKSFHTGGVSRERWQILTSPLEGDLPSSTTASPQLSPPSCSEKELASTLGLVQNG